MRAGKRLHSKVNSFVSLQIVIPVEALRALIAFEGPVIRYRLMMLLLWVAVVYVLGSGSVTTVELWHHPLLHVADHRHWVTGTMYIRHDSALHGRKRV